MTIGHTFAGRCYATPEAAFEAFHSSFPVVDGGAVVSLSSASLAGSMIDYSLTIVSASHAEAVTRTGSIQLAPCETISASMTDNMAGIVGSMLFSFFFAFFARKAIRKIAVFGGGFANDF